MHILTTNFIIFCAVFFASTEARGGRGGGGGRSRSSGSSWGRSSSSSSGSSSSGSSYGSSGSSYGSSGSSYGSSGSSYGSSSHSWDSPSPRRDSVDSPPSSGRDSPSPKRADSPDSPSSSVPISNKPRSQIGTSNPGGDPVSGGQNVPSSNVYMARVWSRSSWVRYGRSRSGGQSNSGNGQEEATFGSNTTIGSESLAPTLYDMLPDCETLGAAMWTKYDELTESGELSSNDCEEESDVCLRPDVQKVRCAVKETIPQECMDEIMAFLKGGNSCSEVDKSNTS